MSLVVLVIGEDDTYDYYVVLTGFFYIIYSLRLHFTSTVNSIACVPHWPHIRHSIAPSQVL